MTENHGIFANNSIQSDLEFNDLHFEQLGSSNVEAIKRINNGLAREGDLIITDWQSAGKGQQNNGWFSDPGLNLLCTLILTPHHLKASEQFVLNQVVSLSAVSVVDHYLPDAEVTLKWPNDLYIDNRKVGGILFQSILKGNFISFTAAGIGLNVNQTWFPEALPNPVSLRQVLQYSLSLSEVVMHLKKYLTFYYNLSRTENGKNVLLQDYLKRLYKYKQSSVFRSGNEEWQGKITGIDEFGQLKVEKTDGQVNTFSFKEIEFVLR